MIPFTVHLFDASSVLHAFGPWVLVGIALLVFVESGVLFPFLPGDSLLVTAAILGSTLGITEWQVLAVASAAAIAGDSVGYWIGRRFGRRLFRDEAKLLTTRAFAKPKRSSPGGAAYRLSWAGSCPSRAPTCRSRPERRGCR